MAHAAPSGSAAHPGIPPRSSAPRSYLNSVALPRITLRTVARDTNSNRTISLIGICRLKNARRIWPILFTPIALPGQHRPKEGDTDETSEGSRLDAKTTPQGVIIASEFTIIAIRED